MDNKTKFRIELEKLINSLSIENGSDTPDFILADYLMDCLKAFELTSNRRSVWYNSKLEQKYFPERSKEEEDDIPF